MKDLIIRIVYIACLLGAYINWPENAQAQEAIDLEAALAEAYEKYAESSLERHLKTGDFKVDVEIDAEDKPELIPYLKGGANLAAIKSLSLSRLRRLTRNISVEVTLLRDFPTSTRAGMTKLLARELKLDEKRGDKVLTTVLDWNRPIERTDLELEVNRAESNYRSERDRAQALSEERTDLKRDLSLSRTELERLQLELTQKNQELVAAKNGGVPVGTADTLATLKQKWPTALFGFALVLGVTLIAMAMFFNGRRLGNAFGGIAKALEKTRSSEALPAPRERTQSSNNARDISGSQNKALPPNAPLMPLESVQARLLTLRAQLDEQLNNSNQTIVVRYLTNLLGSSSSIPQAVVTLELLGREKANQLFGLLSLDSQDSILRFLSHGTYGRQKGELMLEAGEELVTKLLAESFAKHRYQLNDTVEETVLRFKIEDIAEIFRRSDLKIIPRLMLYMDAASLMHAIRAVRDLDKVRYEKVIALLAKMPDAEKHTELDQAIIKELNASLSRVHEDAHRPYLKLYQEIVELSDDDLADDITDKLAKTHPRVGNFLSQNLVSLNTLFQLDSEQRYEIFAMKKNDILAALSLSLSPAQQNIMSESIPERRRPLIGEAINVLKGQSRSQQSRASRQAKTDVLAHLRALQASGELLLAAKAKPESGQRLTDEISMPEEGDNAA